MIKPKVRLEPVGELPMIGVTLVSFLSLALGLAVAWIIRGFVPNGRRNL
jgi:hypothetical protein